jgi:hypothetical protein
MTHSQPKPNNFITFGWKCFPIFSQKSMNLLLLAKDKLMQFVNILKSINYEHFI